MRCLQPWFQSPVNHSLSTIPRSKAHLVALDALPAAVAVEGGRLKRHARPLAHAAVALCLQPIAKGIKGGGLLPLGHAAGCIRLTAGGFVRMNALQMAACQPRRKLVPEDVAAPTARVASPTAWLGQPLQAGIHAATSQQLKTPTHCWSWPPPAPGPRASGSAARSGTPAGCRGKGAKFDQVMQQENTEQVVRHVAHKGWRTAAAPQCGLHRNNGQDIQGTMGRIYSTQPAAVPHAVAALASPGAHVFLQHVRPLPLGRRRNRLRHVQGCGERARLNQQHAVGGQDRLPAL